jgi:hypothetical protein
MSQVWQVGTNIVSKKHTASALRIEDNLEDHIINFHHLQNSNPYAAFNNYPAFLHAY